LVFCITRVRNGNCAPTMELQPYRLYDRNGTLRGRSGRTLSSGAGNSARSAPAGSGCDSGLVASGLIPRPTDAVPLVRDENDRPLRAAPHDPDHLPQVVRHRHGVPGRWSAPPWRCIIYIMRRTQLYLDEHLWNTLHARAKSRNTTVSELVREAARERYLGKRDEQRKAMQDFVGSRKRRSDALDVVQYVRNLRRGDRLERLKK
jgi:hypothetical protein